jgi:hypothetical protein
MDEYINFIIEVDTTYWIVLGLGIVTGAIIPFVYLNGYRVANKDLKQKLGR